MSHPAIRTPCDNPPLGWHQSDASTQAEAGEKQDDDRKNSNRIGCPTRDNRMTRGCKGRKNNIPYVAVQAISQNSGFIDTRCAGALESMVMI
ncbi:MULTISPECIES: hypothetical protein [unclassified Synechococcus]|uniref:hypothetical protein n=1 Tax=unclassified Synechococcus TaxID=2626047 RepID=UPI0020CFB884|nr:MULTISPECIES: hypothetical protein [unclassified Synechococcus]